MDNKQLAVQLLAQVPEDNLTTVISFLEEINAVTLKKSKCNYKKIIDDLYGCCGSCERLCRTINNPNKANMTNVLFAWNDTKPSRRPDSKLIVLLNDNNTISSGVEDGFLNYNAEIIKWSQISAPKNLTILSA